MKLPNGLEIVSLDGNLARVKMQAPVRNAEISFDENLPNRVREIMQTSQWAQQSSDFSFNFRTVADILPKDEDYISVNFRSLSKVVVPGHWLDWTVDGVLEEGVSMLEGATVYPNHNFWNINNWLGSVSHAEWDATGEKFGGIPGINATYKIDALVSPIIARGLLMKPPAIHSTSLTILFEYEFSHPDIATEDRWKFFRLLGEEVDGHIVRLIVKKIVEIWEASLVYQGADRFAKQVKDDDANEETENLSAASFCPPTNSNKEKTMKLTKEQKAELGIEFDGDDVPESLLFKAATSFATQLKGVNLAELQTQAAAGVTLLTEKRTEVTRIATIATLGAKEGELHAIVKQQIDKADATELVELKKYYEEIALEKFPNLYRSSQENSEEVETAGNVKPATKTKTVSKVRLH